MSNKLIHSTSPYLLQHAHNPVNQQGGAEALMEAKNLDKPILVSIGYSSCHWCHVMERESFENNDIAKVMNESFVCIKVDREERPDIDHIYMEAVQAMGMNGGWPLNVFLTPNQKPFYGGTYFPPQNWARLLVQIAKAFEIKRDEINQSADDLVSHLQRSDLDRFAKDEKNEIFKKQQLDQQFDILKVKFDNKWGGIEKAPKFVMPTVWLWLLRYHFISKNKTALDMVLLTLKQMTRAGLYDQLGGGFSRYSVDSEWFAPHFEKMLYDNAQLLSLYAEAYSITKDEFFKPVIYETVEWLKREMMHPEGGFYSALDADSEGVEGKFYAWTWNEIEEAIGDESESVAEYFRCTREGNWEHGLNILIQEINQLLDEKMVEAKKRLFTYREKKIRPMLDDKILTGWNAMTVQGLVDCHKAFGDQMYQLAIRNISFIEKNLIKNEKVYRAFKNKHSVTEGFLEDYAFLIQAYTSLYQVTFDESYLLKAELWTNYVLNNFLDRNENFFSFPHRVSAEQLIAKKKEVFDNVIPPSNSVMARNLFRLGILLDKNEWKQLAVEMASKLSGIITQEPVYMSNWGILFSEITEEINEVVIVGERMEETRKEIQLNYFPFAMFLGSKSKSDLALFGGREAKDDKTRIYVCRNKICQLPVENVKEAIGQMISVSSFMQDNKKIVIILISLATMVRLFFATQVELGNDEVYYWTYALYPDWSHFDHPPMVGVVAQLFSLNQYLTDDFFLRLGPIVLSSASTWIVYRIGTKIKNSRTGLYAAFLFMGSIYCSIISGFSLTPDAPLVFFWLLAINAMIDFLPKESITSTERKKIIWFGVVAGLAMLSKYQGAFLWIGVFVYVIFYNRKWLKEYAFYLSGLISFIVLSPILIWNLQNNFISFAFHTDRVTPAFEIRLDYFFTEIFGQIAYNNPVNYVLIVIALIALFKNKNFIERKNSRILLWVTIPLWVVFTSFSIFRPTLPHWTSPAFISLILIAAAYWSEKKPEQKRIFFWIKFPAFFLATLLFVALSLINYSPFQLGKKSSVSNFGEDDFTQDLYGWNQVGESFKTISEREEKAGNMPTGSGVVSYKWFPGSHLDFYAARPANRDLFLMGELNDIHKYAWINLQRGGLKKGSDYYHIAVSNVYRDPAELFKDYFDKIEPMDTVEIKRANKIMRYAFFYRLKNYKGTFINPLPGR